MTCGNSSNYRGKSVDMEKYEKHVNVRCVLTGRTRAGKGCRCRCSSAMSLDQSVYEAGRDRPLVATFHDDIDAKEKRGEEKESRLSLLMGRRLGFDGRVEIAHYEKNTQKKKIP